jgi:hypothetical protein
MKLKSQNKASREDLRAKEYELEEIKRNIKFTRIQEHDIETNLLQNEIVSLAKVNECLLASNKKLSKNIEELEKYKDNYLKYKKNVDQNEITIIELNKKVMMKDEENQRLRFQLECQGSNLKKSTSNFSTDKISLSPLKSNKSN